MRRSINRFNIGRKYAARSGMSSSILIKQQDFKLLKPTDYSILYGKQNAQLGCRSNWRDLSGSAIWGSSFNVRHKRNLNWNSSSLLFFGNHKKSWVALVSVIVKEPYLYRLLLWPIGIFNKCNYFLVLQGVEKVFNVTEYEWIREDGNLNIIVQDLWIRLVI